MVLLMVIDGKDRIYRGVTYKDLGRYSIGFLHLRHYHRNGELYQLIGKERRLLRKFGTVKIT